MHMAGWDASALMDIDLDVCVSGYDKQRAIVSQSMMNQQAEPVAFLQVSAVVMTRDCQAGLEDGKSCSKKKRHCSKMTVAKRSSHENTNNQAPFS